MSSAYAIFNLSMRKRNLYKHPYLSLSFCIHENMFRSAYINKSLKFAKNTFAQTACCVYALAVYIYFTFRIRRDRPRGDGRIFYEKKREREKERGREREEDKREQRIKTTYIVKYFCSPKSKKFYTILYRVA